MFYFALIEFEEKTIDLNKIDILKQGLTTRPLQALVKTKQGNVLVQIYLQPGIPLGYLSFAITSRFTRSLSQACLLIHLKHWAQKLQTPLKFWMVEPLTPTWISLSPQKTQ